ncbi:hypothetical protein [Niabella beijingensis]|uniref:hypothetical protein n=1 Tax=Niabella beijingensis TaxID=2872700 RepID=UPI001CC128CD|nr:hypothetical protein [Niabella beijingensis]MBZ4189833.1 hypothetical protein [Niabella beijingensis]
MKVQHTGHSSGPVYEITAALRLRRSFATPDYKDYVRAAPLFTHFIDVPESAGFRVPYSETTLLILIHNAMNPDFFSGCPVFLKN